MLKFPMVEEKGNVNPVLPNLQLRPSLISAGQDIGKASAEKPETGGGGADMSHGIEQENKVTRDVYFSAAWKRSAAWNCRH